MKKVFFTFILSICFAVSGQSQTIHWLTFIDTTDKNVGEIDKTGRSVLYDHFVNVVNAALSGKGYKSEIHDYYDVKLSPQSCKSAVEHLQCSPKDIVVFYYIGHGTHAKDENNPYPQMLLGCDWNEENKFIPLNWVHEQLKCKNPQLVVTIGMCCNVIQGARAKTAPTFSVNYGNTYLTDTERNAIQKMFLGYKGDFILSSASPGQSSIGCGTPFGDMDLFTAVLVDNFEACASEGNLQWNALFNDVRDIIHSVTGGKQTPIFASNLTPITVQNQKRTQPAPQPENNSSWLDDVETVGNALMTVFDYIIDPQIAETLRIEQAEKLESLFSNTAVIKTLGQDGNVVVDKASAEDFIGRISTSRILLKIIPVAYAHNGKYITELQVKEIVTK